MRNNLTNNSKWEKKEKVVNGKTCKKKKEKKKGQNVFLSQLLFSLFLKLPFIFSSCILVLLVL